MAEGRVVRVAAIQWAAPLEPALGTLTALIHPPLAQAAQAGAQLVVFAPGIDQALAAFAAREAEPPAAPEVRRFAAEQKLAMALSQRFDALGRALASQYRVVLALGSVLVRRLEGTVRVAYLYGPKGDLLGFQGQTHRSPAEREHDLLVETTLSPIDTPVGRVGLVTGADVEYPEVSRILCLQGAEILVHQGMLARFSEALALSRLWREVQANQVFGVEAYSVAEGCRGRSAIHCPVEMAPDRSGWLARAADDAQPAVVVADLDFDRLKQVTGAYPLHALRNPGLYRRYLPVIYDRSEDHDRA